MEREQNFGEKIIRPRILPQTMQKIENQFGKDKREQLENTYLGYTNDEFDRFEKDICRYTQTYLLQIQRLKDQGVNIEKETIMIFPGMSGIGIEPVVRTALKSRFGKTPFSLRLATDSSLEQGGYLGKNQITYALRRIAKENPDRIHIKNNQEGPIEYWDRSKYNLRSIDKLISKKTYALILDPYATQKMNTLRQILWVLKPYDIKQILFITDSFNIKDETINRLQSIITEKHFKKLEIIDTHCFILDDFSRSFASLFAGIVKISPLLLTGNPPLQFAKSHIIERKDREEIRNYLVALGKRIGKAAPRQIAKNFSTNIL